MSTTPVKLAVATDAMVPEIPTAKGAVRIVVLDGSFAYKGLVKNPIYDSWINDMRANGQLVFGYVPCNHGMADPALVKTGSPGFDTWYSLYPQIDGIYLDEGPEYEASHPSSIVGKTIQDNYIAYSQDIRQTKVIDGTTQRYWRVMMEADMYPFPWVLGVAEFILTWEGSPDDYINKYHGWLQACDQQPPPDWCDKEPVWWRNPGQWNPPTGTAGPERIVHTIYSYTPESMQNPPGSIANPPGMAEFKDVLAKVQGRHAGSVYMTYQPMKKIFVPVSKLYFANELAAI